MGKLYYLHGYKQHKNILLDLIDYSFPEAGELIVTNAHPRVEVILQDFARNTPENYQKNVVEGKILHLINLTGFSGNTYFDPLPIHDISFKIKIDFEPKKIWGMSSEKELDFTYDQGYVALKLDRLDEFEGVVIEK